ncbi:hypothetical protein BLNAU_19613 [Blattamonas nauphoetae]|uniref:RING-type domain-containing protein n=1 Tax=Blattamonas nauphoetae TaxID=2049346 RepID=A0ABQ9X0Y4_9EUKA|nr:hypothetical protein BLNAU_19613 [Blattamonas nauphoetae]
MNISPSNCSICLSPIDQPALLSSCSHVFDLECILQVLDYNKNSLICPICRTSMTLILYNFNPSNRTCSVFDIVDASSYTPILESMTDSSSLCSQSETSRNRGSSAVDKLKSHFSARHNVPLMIVRTFVQNKPANLTPYQVYRRCIYQEHLFPEDVLPKHSLQQIDHPFLLPTLLILSEGFLWRELQMLLDQQDVSLEIDFVAGLLTAYGIFHLATALQLREMFARHGCSHWVYLFIRELCYFFNIARLGLPNPLRRFDQTFRYFRHSMNHKQREGHFAPTISISDVENMIKQCPELDLLAEAELTAKTRRVKRSMEQTKVENEIAQMTVEAQTDLAPESKCHHPKSLRPALRHRPSADTAASNTYTTLSTVYVATLAPALNVSSVEKAMHRLEPPRSRKARPSPQLIASRVERDMQTRHGLPRSLSVPSAGSPEEAIEIEDEEEEASAQILFEEFGEEHPPHDLSLPQETLIAISSFLSPPSLDHSSHEFRLIPSPSSDIIDPAPNPIRGIKTRRDSNDKHRSDVFPPSLDESLSRTRPPSFAITPTLGQAALVTRDSSSDLGGRPEQPVELDSESEVEEVARPFFLNQDASVLFSEQSNPPPSHPDD